MPIRRWSDKFYGSTRGRIVSLLRQSDATVDQLATALGLTGNAVRAHLATLERDGIVEQRAGKSDGGVGKPAYSYAIAPDAEPIFSRAYVPVLIELLHVLAQRLPPRELETVLKNVGHRLAAAQATPRGTMKERAEAATAVLNELGGIAELEEQRGTLSIRGASCPLGSAAGARPEVCHAVESFLTELVGTPVHERCQHGDRPRCCFEIDAARRKPAS